MRMLRVGSSSSEPCHNDVVDSQLDRQVSQWLGGLFVC